MILRTSRLVLRSLRQGDSEAVFALMSDDEAMRYWDWPALRDHETVAEIVSRQIAGMDEGTALYWAVELAGPGTFLGVCDLSEIDRRHRRAEVGFLFGRAWWGNGYAFEAMSAIVAHAFGPLDLRRLWARFHDGNESSRRLLERLGFAYEGMLRGHIVRDGAPRDCLIYGRLA
ncbi:MAG TPA: GNAT family N-acetyltransferase [Rhizomicrobium sp.]|nr:GNAT family N-acetyltransferase [Rhizomicrobium sp.]